MRWVLALGLLAACDGGGNIGVGGNGNNPNGVDIPTRDPDQVLTGDLSTGVDMDLSFADDVEYTCFPATENPNFNGKHVFFTVEGAEMLTIAVDPDAGVDTSVYAMGYNGDVPATPDERQPATNCEAGYDEGDDSNPGQVDATVLFLSDPAWGVLIGVAGANGASSGAFELKIWRDDTNLE